MSSAAGIGVIGGSGFYEFLDAAEEVKVDTPFGPPSDPVTVGEVAGRRVAFLPRHGRDHRLPPHRIPYRANLWALRSLGVRQVIAPSAVGSLTASFGPGTLVVPDQLVDRTSGRTQTFLTRAASTSRSPTRTVRAVASGPSQSPARPAGRRCRRARSSSSRASGSPPARSHSGSPRRAGRWSA